VQGVLDRFGQIEPKVLFCADGYIYGGKEFDSQEKASQVLDKLPSVEECVVVDYIGAPATAGTSLYEFLDPFDAGEIRFEPVEFNHPLYILYSSGTTGVPKCIVHGTGGALLQHLKEHRLQSDIKAGDRLFYFTTLGWMMWNWLVSGPGSGATLLLYDGSPFVGRGKVLFDFADAEGMTHFGTSAKFIDAIAKTGVRPKQTHRLEKLRTILSTGSPLAPEGFDYVYQEVKSDVCLSSISGGTDIVSCFVLGNPMGPVWRGEIQAKGLGLAVEVFDESGKPVRQKKGELVCTRPFPAMPVGFWNDPDGSKYRAAYFEKYPNVWRHGDWCEETEHGGIIIYGRSDAVLNPGGVRIGTAEIYRQVEQLDEVVESLVIGQDWNGDVRVVLFVSSRKALPDEPSSRRSRIRQTPPAPCAGEGPAGRRHPAHQERQDRRARGARRGARPAGEEPRSARQPRSARALPQPLRAGDLDPENGQLPFLQAIQRRDPAHAVYPDRRRAKCWLLQPFPPPAAMTYGRHSDY
jgi:acetoacetyl-CoA synthetase